MDLEIAPLKDLVALKKWLNQSTKAEEEVKNLKLFWNWSSKNILGVQLKLLTSRRGFYNVKLMLR